MNKTEESFIFSFYFGFIPQYVICLFGVVSHIFLFVAFVKDPFKCFRNSGIYLVANLAVFDFLMCLLGPIRTSETYRIEVVVYLTNTINCISFVTILSISLDRCIMVSYPIKHRILSDRKLMVGWISLIWLLCVLILLKGFIFGSRTKNEELIANIILPLIIVFATVLYIKTYFTLKKQSKNISLQDSANTIANRSQETRNLKEQRFLITIIIIATIAFFTNISSYPVYQFILSSELYTSNYELYKIMVGISGAIYYINFAINPLIYFTRLPNYRKTFVHLFLQKQS